MKRLLNWFMIPCSDFERAYRFYSKVFDAKLKLRDGINETKMAFFIDPDKNKRSNTNGGIIWSNQLRPGRNGTIICINSNNHMREMKKRIVDAGGIVVQQDLTFGKYGSLLFFIDSEGNLIGLHKNKTK